jgi:hypothetical protein
MLNTLLAPWASIDLNGPVVPTLKHWPIGIWLAQYDTISVPEQSAEFHPWKQRSVVAGGEGEGEGGGGGDGGGGGGDKPDGIGIHIGSDMQGHP